MYERILLPTDGSTGTPHVALEAIDIAERYGATVHVVHVVDAGVRSLLGDDDGRLDARAERAVERVELMARAHGVDVETEVLEGDPASEIQAYADDHGVDLLVVGTHGRTGLGRHLLGSVAERLVRRAAPPVLTVRLPETDVTVDAEEDARQLVREALEAEGVEGSVAGLERQVNVWVAEVEADGEEVVYLDPVTRRTSLVSQ